MEKNLNESNKKIKDLNDRFKFTSKRKLGESNWMKGSSSHIGLVILHVGLI